MKPVRITRTDEKNGAWIFSQSLLDRGVLVLGLESPIAAVLFRIDALDVGIPGTTIQLIILPRMFRNDLLTMTALVDQHGDR